MEKYPGDITDEIRTFINSIKVYDHYMVNLLKFNLSIIYIEPNY